jgi:hypothetical protein
MGNYNCRASAIFCSIAPQHPKRLFSQSLAYVFAARRTVGQLGEQKWQFIDGCQRDWDTLPPPGPPLTVGLTVVLSTPGSEVPWRGLVGPRLTRG